MTASGRLSLLARARSEPFRSPENGRALVTVAAVSGADPVFRTAGPTGFVITVVEWPSDASGAVIPDRVRAGEARVRPWHMSPAEVAELDRLLAMGWRLDEVDLLVGGGPNRPRFVPSPCTLRASPFWPAPSEDEIARLLAAA